jgi:hypothetical protein
MITIKGTAEELAHLFEAFIREVRFLEKRGIITPDDPVTTPLNSDSPLSRGLELEESGVTQAESFWGSPVPTSKPNKKKIYEEQMLKERSESGGIAWYHLVSAWSQNFAMDGDQPDRANILTDMMNNHGRDVLFFISKHGGLTRAVQSVRAESSSKAESRLIAENIASVSSALGIGLSDFLEYDQESRTLNE